MFCFKGSFLPPRRSWTPPFLIVGIKAFNFLPVPFLWWLLPTGIGMENTLPHYAAQVPADSFWTSILLKVDYTSNLYPYP